MKLTRFGFALIAGVAVTATLTGCLQWFLPPRVESTSQPTGEEVADDLQEYYHQVLRWDPCGGGMQCTTARAPMDWSDPGAAEI